MRLLTLLLLLLTMAPAYAQLATTPTPATVAPAPDTVVALHRLFASRRARRNLIATGLGAGVVVAALTTATTANDHYGSRGYGNLSTGPQFQGTDWLLLYALPAAPLIALDLAVYATYSHKNEKQAITDFRAHHLSKKLRRKLKSRYFRL